MRPTILLPILLFSTIEGALANTNCAYSGSKYWRMTLVSENLYIFSIKDGDFKYNSGLLSASYPSGYFRDVHVDDIKMVKSIVLGGVTYSIGELLQSREYGIDYSMNSERIFGLCKAPVSAFYKKSEKEVRSLSCPTAQPSGFWKQSRTYELWSDGSHRNHSAWVDSAKTCAAVKQSTKTQNRVEACSVGETGSVKKIQTYEIWSDGAKRNYSDWQVSSNTCKAVPTRKTEVKDGVQEETCDSYYGVAQGTYSGTVYKHGTYTTTYSEASKTTDTKFQLDITNVDLESCVAQITDVIQESDELACPPGQTGSIQLYRIKATNSQGKISYPYGTQWEIRNNNCASTEVDYQPITSNDTTPDGLLSNISITSSNLLNSESFTKYLNSLSASNWATNERHKLIVNIDDLSSGKYSASKVGAVISKFQSVVGSGNADIEISLPRTIDKYVGNGGITAKAVNEKTVTLKDISFDGFNVSLTYLEFSKVLTEKPKTKEMVINVIPANLGLKNVSSN